MKKILHYLFFPVVNTKYELEKHWWHRLVKVLYIFFIIWIFIYLENSVIQSYGFEEYYPTSKFPATRQRDMLIMLIPTYFAAMILQLFYYKIILYIIFGKK